MMVLRDEMAVEILTVLGWYKGYITLPAGGRLLDYLNTKPIMIALTQAVKPDGSAEPFVALNMKQVLAMRLQPEV
jgi:hypothetical protein